jgi:hypothetical protein
MTDFPDLQLKALTGFLGWPAPPALSTTQTILRVNIPSTHILAATFVASGFYAEGDSGAGALYSSGGASPSGPMAIQDLVGTWFNLVVHGPANVGWFGAKGDGIANDTVAITAAIAALPAAGGHLYFPPGTYNTTGGFTVNVPATISGSGSFGSYSATVGVSKVVTSSANTPLFKFTASYARVSDLAMRCSAATPAAGSSAIVYQGTDQFGRIIIEKCQVESFYDAIDIVTGAEHKVMWNLLNNATHYGLRRRNTLNTDAGNAVIAFNSIYPRNTAVSGIQYESGGGDTYTGNFILCSEVGLIQNGMTVDFSSFGGATEQVRITNNVFDFNANAALNIVRGCAAMTIMGNILFSNGARAFYCKNISFSVIVGNVLQSNGVGIEMDSAPDNIVGHNRYNTNNGPYSYTGSGVAPVTENLQAIINDNPAFSATIELNNAATFFDGAVLRARLTNTASDPSSLLIDLIVNNNGKFQVDLAGRVFSGSGAGLTDGGFIANNLAPGNLANIAGDALYLDRIGHNQIQLNGTNDFAIIGTGVGTGVINSWAFGSSINGTAIAHNALIWNELGSVFMGPVTSTSTDGFFYINGDTGPPTGIPTALAGRIPLYYDQTNNFLYVFNGGWKKTAVFA